MIVTTAGRTNEDMISFAREVAKDLQVTFILRKKQSVLSIQKTHQEDVLVVGKDRLELHPFNLSDPLFFHPNSAMFRVKRIINGESEHFLDVVNLHEGSIFIDCTLGLASDSIVASYVVGESGQVLGVEASETLAYIVSKGLQKWETGIPKMDQALRRIKVNVCHHQQYLESLPDDFADVVYFDPMFTQEIPESTGISGIREMAIYEPLTIEAITQAKRVAKKRIVLKDHWKSDHFERLGFTVRKRKTAKFYYGVIELS
ncbi:class I SAM-dependent methyltransferase [Metabacillus herbersteinensis]|uniref:Class I SAM-dependent methyltransferase n=1 Tax=Metabacillus herbersteinensis TaxID=283816 RepID=A0ABV6GDU4_9BACI